MDISKTDKYSSAKLDTIRGSLRFILDFCKEIAGEYGIPGVSGMLQENEWLNCNQNMCITKTVLKCYIFFNFAAASLQMKDQS